MTDKKQHANNDTKPRRTYVQPKLNEYGNVREFTRGGGGSKADKQAPQV